MTEEKNDINKVISEYTSRSSPLGELHLLDTDKIWTNGILSPRTKDGCLFSAYKNIPIITDETSAILHAEQDRMDKEARYRARKSSTMEYDMRVCASSGDVEKYVKMLIAGGYKISKTAGVIVDKDGNLTDCDRGVYTVHIDCLGDIMGIFSLDYDEDLIIGKCDGRFALEFYDDYRE